MVYTPEIFTVNVIISAGPTVTVKKPVQENHSVYLMKYFDSRKKTNVGWAGAAKSNPRGIKSGSILWSNIPKKIVYKKSMKGF